MSDKTFNEVGPLVIGSEVVGSAYCVRLTLLHKQWWINAEAIALQDWLASATGYYPKEPKP